MYILYIAKHHTTINRNDSDRCYVHVLIVVGAFWPPSSSTIIKRRVWEDLRRAWIIVSQGRFLYNILLYSALCGAHIRSSLTGRWHHVTLLFFTPRNAFVLELCYTTFSMTFLCYKTAFVLYRASLSTTQEGAFIAFRLYLSSWRFLGASVHMPSESSSCKNYPDEFLQWNALTELMFGLQSAAVIHPFRESSFHQ